MQPRIGVVCAFNQRNAGMVSVDLAAAAYFGARPCAFELFMAAPTALGDTLGGHPLGVLGDPAQLEGFTDIVYWGDFLHNPVYGRWDFGGQMVRAGLAATRAEGLPIWRRLFLLSDEAAPGPRMLSVGGNFQHDFGSVGRNADADLARLLDRAALILPRDPVSLENLRSHAPPEAQSKLRPGLDAAFLLPRGDVASDPASRQFLHVFGRSGVKAAHALVAAAAAASGCEPASLGRWLRLPPDKGVATFERMRAQIAAARFVLTDIYHLAVNAMNLGVPVILLARPAAAQKGTLGDFKKHTLMAMLDLGDWLVPLPAKGGDDAGAGPAVGALAARLAAREGAGSWFTTLDRLRDDFRRALDAALFPGLAAAPVAGPAAGD